MNVKKDRTAVASRQLKAGAVFIVVAVGLAAAVVLLALIAAFAPTEFTFDHAPKLIGATFLFVVAMLAGLFVDKEGLRRPTTRELRSKLPVVVVGLMLSLGALLWYGQLTQHEDLKAKLAMACDAARPVEGQFGPIFDTNVAKALSEAKGIALKMNGLWLVSHRTVLEEAPCS